MLKSIVLVLFAATAALAQTAADYGQCGGTGWTGATLCPTGWTCTELNAYYWQCLQSSSTAHTVTTVTTTISSYPTTTPTTTPTTHSTSTTTTTTTITPTTTPISGSSTLSVPSQTASGTTPLQTGYNWVRADSEPYFHYYLQSQTLNSASNAVLGSPATAGQFIISSGQLIQQNTASMAPLYAVVEPRANSSVMKLLMSWSTTPATGSAAGTFSFSGDTLEWVNANITRQQNDAWYICPDSAGNADVYINLGAYDYDTPAGCEDETIHAYTGTTAVP
ncbi:carbohydrate-binding module family 1 protein [Jaapia argillacea MUCL 33604]|uniref:Carbohydrate-binding module family 1 protein n=1 Tax=Jaapia argillacea MUCL 33604 TaxID=933084 RepID=A0A067PGX4_9AGAM|nr:carbohydrate-binding module family 1 protein [Jaapia argillacea MUCL 33604]